MQINALRFRLTNSNDWRIWRFVGGRGRAQGAGVFCDEPRELRAITAGLEFAMVGTCTMGLPVTAAAILFTDLDGDDWILQREDDKLTLSKDGKKIPDEDITRTLAQLTENSDTATKGQLPWGLFEVRSQGGELSCAAPGAQDPKPALDLAVARECRKIMVQLQELLEPTAIMDEAEKWLEKGASWEQLKLRLVSLRHQIEEQSNAELSINPEEVRDYRKLRRNLQLASKVQKLTLMLQSGPNITEMSKDRDLIDGEIAEIKESHNLARVDEVKLAGNFKPLITVLTKITMWESAIRTAEETRRFADKVLVPELNSYLEMIGGELDAHAGVFSELQSCLESLDIVAKKAVPEGPREEAPGKPQGHHFSNWFERFKAHQKDKVVDGTGEETCQQNSPALLPLELNTDHLRAYVSHIHDRITSLKEGIEHFRGEHEEGLDRLDEAGERAVAEFTSLKDRWRTMAHAIGVPDHFRIEQVLRLVLHALKLKELLATRAKLDKAITLRSEQLELLHHHLNLYERTCGLNETPEETPEQKLIKVALSYSQRIPRLKERQESLQKKIDAHGASVAILTYLGQESRRVSRRLELSFEGFARPLTFQDQNFNQIIRLIQKLRALHELRNQSNNIAGPLFQGAVLECPIPVLKIDSACHVQVGELQAALGEADFVGNPIVLTTDKTIAADLKQKGFRTGIKVTPKQRISGARAAQPPRPLPPIRPKTIMGADTKEALEALLTRPAGSRRRPL